MIKLKRAYESAEKEDGRRILVDRLWPRGVSKERAKINLWAKELAPSTELRKWFAHDPEKWPEFQQRYRKELEANQAALNQLAKEASNETVTLVYGTKDEEHNEAIVLKSVLDNRSPRMHNAS